MFTSQNSSTLSVRLTVCWLYSLQSGKASSKRSVLGLTTGSDGEAPVLEIWEMTSSLSLLLFPSPHWTGVRVSVDIPSIDQIDLFENYFYSIQNLISPHTYLILLAGKSPPLEQANCILCRRVRFPQKIFLGMALNYIRWWGFGSGILRRVEYPFIAISLTFTQTWSDNTC